MVKVKGTAKLFKPGEDVEIKVFAQFADYLPPAVHAITVDDNGLLTGVSTDLEEDETLFLAYLPFSMAKLLSDCPTIQYSKLQEVDRLGPGVDLSSYEDEDELGVLRKVVFKYNVLQKPLRLQMAWDEVNLLKSLPPHPNLVPFDRVVLEDIESRIIGFTTKFITIRMYPFDSSGYSSLPSSWTFLILSSESCIKILLPGIYLSIPTQISSFFSTLIGPHTGKSAC